MQRRMTLGRIAATAAVSAAALLLASCAPAGANGGNDGTSGAGNSGGKTYTVGVLVSQSGFAAATGKDMQQGWELYWKQHDNKAGDYTVVSDYEDDASDANTGLSKAQRLVEDEHVDALMGPVLANVALAVADYANKQKVADLSQTSADDVTERKAGDYVIRTGAFSGSQSTFAGGQWAYDQGYKTAVTLCPDYAFGWDQCGGFASAYLAAGGKIVKQLWYPQGTADLSSYVTQLASTNADVIFAGTTGGTDAVGFLQAADQFGLLGKRPILTGPATATANPLSQIGDSAIGLNSVSYYAEGADTPANDDFRKAYESAYNAIPSIYASGAYQTAQLLAKALESSSSKPTGTDLVDAIKTAATGATDLVWGKVSFDDYNGIVAPLYIRKVEKRDDGKLWNVVQKQYDDVSQFWTFDPSKWLASPAFSNTFTHQ